LADRAGVTQPLVYIPDPIDPVGLEVLEPHCQIVAPWREGDTAGPIPADAAAAMVRNYVVDGPRMDGAPGLRCVVKHGVGYDNIDVDAASERGLPVLWTPEANADAVAQHALALILGLANRLKEAETAVRDGRFLERIDFGARELTDLTLGIVGLGRIGRRVARRAITGLGMQVLAYDPYIDDGAPATLVPSLAELMQRADVVSLHVPLTDETRGFIDADALSHARPGTFLVNTSRGPVIDEPALVQALSEGRLAGAGLDVFADEPPPPDHPYLTAPKVILTPHVAGLSDQALVRVARQAAEGILDVLQGRRPRDVVNPQVLPD
jgi:phosphoglycerate dehydrogenase-like enzyme